MKAAGMTLKEEPHTLRVPRSQRGGEASPLMLCFASPVRTQMTC
jgi:hypothetical protein